MAKYAYPKRFAVLGHQRVSRYELEDVRAYARLATALMTAESDKHAAHVDSAVEGMVEQHFLHAPMAFPDAVINPLSKRSIPQGFLGFDDVSTESNIALPATHPPAFRVL